MSEPRTATHRAIINQFHVRGEAFDEIENRSVKVLAEYGEWAMVQVGDWPPYVALKSQLVEHKEK